MTVKATIAAVIAVFMLFLCGCQNAPQTPEPPEVKYDFTFSVLKVGQADAIILKTENHCVMIDCGEKDDGDEIIAFLQSNNIASVDYLFITHFDKDHVGGAAQVIENVHIGSIVTPDYEGSRDEYKKFQKAAKQKNIAPKKLDETLSFVLDDVLFEVFPPLKRSYEQSDNDFSLAVSVTHGENTFLFAGDAEAERLTEIIAQTDKSYDFLKVPHHGKFNEKTTDFIACVKPSYAVITCSKKNPAEERTVVALENVGCAVYYTKDGDVTVVSDGQTLRIHQ